MPIHTVFDLLAWGGGGLLGLAVRRCWLAGAATPDPIRHPWWYASAILGAVAGAVALGTLNIHLAGLPGMGKSVVGALAGAIAAVEAYKHFTGLSGSTGLGVVAPLAFGIAVGRIGCLLSGLEDFTYGTPTTLPWGHDFGDGVLRHPVQLYESLAMAAFAAFYVVMVLNRNTAVITNGFYLVLFYYGLQRFVWEFIKPYGALIGPFSLFHLLSLFVMVYAAIMLATAPNVSLKHERAAA